MLFAPWFRTFLFFYHLLSICPYIFSSGCDHGCDCNHCCVFFSFSSFLEIFPSMNFYHLNSLIFTMFVSTISCEMAQFAAFKASISSWFNPYLRAFPLSWVILDSYSYLRSSDRAIILSRLYTAYLFIAMVASTSSLKSIKA